MKSLAHQFLEDLNIAPPNGLYSTDFTRRYGLSFKKVKEEFSKLVDLGWATFHETSLSSDKDFRVKITPLGQHNLQLYNSGLDLRQG